MIPGVSTGKHGGRFGDGNWYYGRGWRGTNSRTPYELYEFLLNQHNELDEHCARKEGAYVFHEMGIINIKLHPEHNALQSIIYYEETKELL